MRYTLRCDILLRNAICCLTATRKEFISYRNGAKRNYIAFEQSENISHECKRVYRLKGLHLNRMPRNMENFVERRKNMSLTKPYGVIEKKIKAVIKNILSATNMLLEFPSSQGVPPWSLSKISKKRFAWIKTAFHHWHVCIERINSCVLVISASFIFLSLNF